MFSAEFRPFKVKTVWIHARNSSNSRTYGRNSKQYPNVYYEDDINSPSTRFGSYARSAGRQYLTIFGVSYHRYRLFIAFFMSLMRFHTYFFPLTYLVNWRGQHNRSRVPRFDIIHRHRERIHSRIASTCRFFAAFFQYSYSSYPPNRLLWKWIKKEPPTEQSNKRQPQRLTKYSWIIFSVC